MPYTQPCPGRRCGVDNHDPLSAEGIRCREITQRISQGNVANPVPSLAATGIQGNDSFAGVYAEITALPAANPHLRLFRATLETETSENPIVIDHAIEVAIDAEVDLPTTAEVLYGLAQDRLNYYSVDDASEYGQRMGLDDNREHEDLSAAEAGYQRARERNEQLDALVGDDQSALRAAIIEIEGEAFDPEAWLDIVDFGQQGTAPQNQDPKLRAAMAERAELDEPEPARTWTFHPHEKDSRYDYELSDEFPVKLGKRGFTAQLQRFSSGRVQVNLMGDKGGKYFLRPYLYRGGAQDKGVHEIISAKSGEPLRDSRTQRPIKAVFIGGEVSLYEDNGRG